MARVSTSLLSLCTWLETSEGCRKLSDLILSCGPARVSGYEAGLCWEELECFVEALEEGFYGLPASCCRLTPGAQRHIRSLPSLSFHLADAKNLGFDHERWAAHLLGRLHRVLRNARFVIHPDETTFGTFSRLTSEIVEPWVVTIENMCPRKISHVSLPEISALLRSEPKLGLTFDVCHWIEAGGDYSGTELRDFFTEFGSRTRALHVSVPTSCFSGYSGYDGLAHHLCVRSGLSIEPLLSNLLGFLPHDVSLVIEGYVPPLDEVILSEEIEYLGRWRDGAVPMRRKAAA